MEQSTPKHPERDLQRERCCRLKGLPLAATSRSKRAASLTRVHWFDSGRGHCIAKSLEIAGCWLQPE
jgi:hypothetical protein